MCCVFSWCRKVIFVNLTQVTTNFHTLTSGNYGTITARDTICCYNSVVTFTVKIVQKCFGVIVQLTKIWI